MKEVMRTNDPIRLSWAQAELAGIDVACVVLDTYASVLEGSVVAIQQRLMVEDADFFRARTHLKAASDALE